ncbi:MAG TPA: hypothetical protein VJA94_06645 [Candidatus Angelobacter sp.]
MRTLLASTTVLFTILFSLAFGVGCGYVAVAAILRAFGQKAQQPETAPTGIVIATTVSGR